MTDWTRVFNNHGKKRVVITVSDWEGLKRLTITLDDVAEYYKTQASNITSGCRILSGHVGDWRQIDAIAYQVLEYFKEVNIEGMRRAAKRVGLIPKF